MINLRNACVLLVALWSFAPAQPAALKPKAKLLFNFDYACFQYNDTSSVVEIGYAVYPGLVTLIPTAGGYHGAVEFRVAVRDADKGKLAALDRMILPVDLADTGATSLHTFRVGKSFFVLGPGRYKFDATAIDSAAPGRIDSAMTYFEVRPKSSETITSDVQLCMGISASNDKSDPFYKNSYRVLDNPSRVFSTVSSPVVYTYIELYNLKIASTYTLASQVMDGNGKVLRERTRQRQFNLPDAVDVSTLNINTVDGGKYRFVYTLSDSTGKAIARAEKPIYILNPSTQTISSTGAPVSLALAGLSADELKDEFDRAKYLMTPDDIKAFKPLTSAEARRGFLSRFWSEVESGTRSSTAITRTTYMQRIAKANEKYRTMTKEGWNTDRGRVFIVYGEPDEIERYPDSEGRKPFEIWKFQKIEGGVDFVFVDRWKNGNYELITSTKRGELQDPNWESLLH